MSEKWPSQVSRSPSHLTECPTDNPKPKDIQLIILAVNETQNITRH